jgi:tetratricopeptide (TPR) repeat protein
MLTRDYYLRALALQQLGRDQEAIKAFLKMIAVAPDEHWKKLARLYLEPV